MVNATNCRKFVFFNKLSDNLYSMRRKRIFQGLFIVLALAVLAYGGFFIVRLMLPQTLNEGEYRLACAGYGNVMLTVDAEGIVEPENEVLLLSPASSIIKKIHKVPGSHVNTGDVILILDPEPVKEGIERLEDQLEVMRNSLQKNRLNSRSTRIDLDYNVEMKKLKVASIKSELTDQEQLLEVGGISPAAFEKTKQELVIAEKDLEMILEKNRIRLQQLEADEKGLLLEIDMHERELNAKRELLNNMIVRAPSDGIVLNIYGKEGEKINNAQLLVQMSDLTTYKVIGSVDEKMADMIKTGRTVYAVFDDEQLPGKIGNIKPLIEDNRIQFDVHLNEGSHENLIPNLRLDLKIITMQKDSVLRVPNGPALEGNSQQNVFVYEPGRAVKREIETGIASPEYVEIVSGLEENECIIISDVSSFRHMKEILLEDE